MAFRRSAGSGSRGVGACPTQGSPPAAVGLARAAGCVGTRRADPRPVARVLIVDDTEIVRKALERAVTKMGHRAVSTSDSVEALAMALKDPPDLALLDFRMPRMGGAELFEEMRAVLGPRCPKVLFISATPAEEVRLTVERIGKPAGYMRKPFHLDDLVKLVREALDTAA